MSRQEAEVWTLAAELACQNRGCMTSDGSLLFELFCQTGFNSFTDSTLLPIRRVWSSQQNDNEVYDFIFMKRNYFACCSLCHKVPGGEVTT